MEKLAKPIASADYLPCPLHLFFPAFSNSTLIGLLFSINMFGLISKVG